MGTVSYPAAGADPELLRAGAWRAAIRSTPSTTPWDASPSSSGPSGCCFFFARLNREKLPLTWGQADMTKPHLLHHFIWNSLMLAPLLAVLGALFGYFYTSRTPAAPAGAEPAGGGSAACSSTIWPTAGC